MKYSIPLFLQASLLALAPIVFFSCSGHETPDHVLNPDSAIYVGDSLATADADADGIPDFLQDSEKYPDCNGDVNCIAQEIKIDSLEAIAQRSSEAAASSQQQNSSDNTTNTSSETTSNSSSNGESSSSQENISSSSTDPILGDVVTISLTNATIKGSEESTRTYSFGMPVSITANQPAINKCFDSWTGDTDVLTDATKPAATFFAPETNVSLTATFTNCMGQYQDMRDGSVYDIQWNTGASKLWMMQNLRYRPSQGNSWCYGDDDEACETYGALYDWATAMDLPASANEEDAGDVSGSQGICPTGWHVATVDELLADVDQIDIQTSGFLANDGSNSGYNGHDLLPSNGWGYPPIGFYWTSQVNAANPEGRNYCDGQYTNTDACATTFVYSPENGGEEWRIYAQEDDKENGFSVRCVFTAP
jgi:uncharacterized protein (TIGR02145 family)